MSNRRKRSAVSSDESRSGDGMVRVDKEEVTALATIADLAKPFEITNKKIVRAMRLAFEQLPPERQLEYLKRAADSQPADQPAAAPA